MKEKHIKKNDKRILFLSILRFVFIVLFIISIAFIAKWIIDRNENKKLEKKISEIVIVDNIKNDEEKIENKYKIDFVKLKEINEDIIAWVKVNGTNVEFPIVQTTNNEYYLKHNLNKEYNIAGAIFADYRNKFNGTDKNIIIYGHNMRDDSMFGSLRNILKEEWYNNQENHIINFHTENQEYKYEVFSIYEIKNEEYYLDTEFKEEEFINFAQTLKNRSIKDFGIEIEEKDRILTLSTCANNKKYRIVLHAKKIIDTTT